MKVLKDPYDQRDVKMSRVPISQDTQILLPSHDIEGFGNLVLINDCEDSVSLHARRRSDSWTADGVRENVDHPVPALFVK